MLRCLTILSSLLFVGSMIACGEAPSTATVSAAGGLRMRAEPNTSANRITTIPDGSAVQILSTSGEEIELAGKRGKWTEVQYEDQSGWVFGGFLVSASNHPEISTASSDSGCPSSLSFKSIKAPAYFTFGGIQEGALKIDLTADSARFHLGAMGDAEWPAQNGTWDVDDAGTLTIQFSHDVNSACMDDCKAACMMGGECGEAQTMCEQSCSESSGFEAETLKLKRIGDLISSEFSGNRYLSMEYDICDTEIRTEKML